jgi:hypothetical protein
VSYLRSFAPWLVFAAGTAVDWRVGALAGFLAAVATTLDARRRGHPLDGLLLDIGSAVFFAVLATVAFADPHSPVAGWSAALSLAWLGLVAWLSLAVRRPFTLGIARQSTPRELWSSPVFYRVNATITAVWAASFTAIAVATVVVRLTHAGTVAAVAIHAGYVVPILFTRRYPAVVRARYANPATD